MKVGLTLASFLLCALLGSCASTKVADATPGFRPQASDKDEAGIWFAMDRVEKNFAEAPERVRDPALQRYLNELNCRLAPDLCADIRIYLVRQPYLNAFMAPNGMMVLFTGTLARAENEAQLAFVMAHEIGHYRSRHSIENWRHQKNVSNVMAGIGTLTGGSAAGIVAVLGAYANLASFSREQEREADTLGFSALAAAKLDLRAPGLLWAAAYEEERVNPRGMLSGVFASHPATPERRDRLSALASSRSEQFDPGAHRFREVIAPYRAEWLSDELSRRNYRQSEVLFNRLAALPWDRGTLKGLQGELFRKRAQAGDLERAVSAYQQAVAEADSPPSAYRDLGTTLRRLGRDAEAKAAFAQYLKREPNADDAAIIRSYLQ